MRRKDITLLTLVISLLTSCKASQIRSDISNFIASFSLEESVKSYLVAGYQMDKILIQNGQETKTVETVNFNVSDVSNPQYLKKKTVYQNGVLESEETSYILREEERFYYVSSEGKQAKSLQECHDIIEKFFYTETMFENTFHRGGMYYGDQVKQGIEYYQPYVTIDEENELYKYKYEENSYDGEGKDLHKEISYSVNKLGMLHEEYILEYNSVISQELTLKVFRI